MKKNLFLLLGTILVFVSTYAQYKSNAPLAAYLQNEKAERVDPDTGLPMYTLSQISKTAEKYFARHDPNRKGSGYKPFKRWEHYWQYFTDKDGYILPSKVLYQAYKDKITQPNTLNTLADWSNIGPVNTGLIRYTPGTGRINQMAVDPVDDQIWYAGAPSGGLWKSFDAGQSWDPIFDKYPQIGVSGIAIDETNTDIIYIATGDDDALDSYSIGVMKSTDAGVTWQETDLTSDNMGRNNALNEIVIHPSDSNIIYVAGSNGFYKSVDAGVNFERSPFGGMSVKDVTDFKLNPGNPDIIYAVTNDGFYRSTDGGDNFVASTSTVLPEDFGRAVLGVSPASPNTVYVLYAETGANDYEFEGLYRSNDDGATFTKTAQNANILESPQAWFDLAIAVDPEDINTVYVGCLNIWKSTNGGNIFGKLNEWSIFNEAFSHADIHTLKFFNNTLYAGTDGGLYSSADGGDTFIDHSINGIMTSQFYRMGMAKNDAGKMVGGTQDNAGFIYNNSQWNTWTGGDGMDYEIDPTNSNIAYGFTQFGSTLWVTTQNGQNLGYADSPEQGNWITPLTVSANGQVFAGFQAVYRLSNGGWTKLSDNLTGSNIDDLEASPNNPDILYAAEDNRLFISEDGGENFRGISQFDNPISDITINSNDNRVVYVTTSNRVGTAEYQQPANPQVMKVIVPETGNAEKIDITGDLPDNQAFLAIIHQQRDLKNSIFLGTSLGVYRTDDDLIAEGLWEDYSNNLPNTAVSDLEISVKDAIIAASTYGRGIFTSPINVEIADYDVSLLALRPGANRLYSAGVTPQIDIQNAGLQTIDEVTVNYSINEVEQEAVTYSVSIPANGEATLDLPSLDQSVTGQVDLSVNITTTDDAWSDNNTQEKSLLINSNGSIGTLYDGETTEGELLTYNDSFTTSVWELGTPTGTLLNQTASGEKAWATNLDGEHPNMTRGYILSPYYNFSEILAPKLTFSMAFNLETNWDLVYVQYTVDQGQNWRVLGTINSGPKWYNSDRTLQTAGDDCYNCVGAQWTGTDNEYATMTEYSYDFEANKSIDGIDLTTETEIAFRVVFESDEAVTEEGVVIDDFIVSGYVDDEDDDDDGILDVDDNCPLTPNTDQSDLDGDGIGDVCDDDDDGDGIIDSEDNCPTTPNANQADADGDGIGDVCDTDNDNDGVLNDYDQCPETAPGAIVNVNGCEIISLPANAFTIQTTAVNCSGNSNGIITITLASGLPEGTYNAVLSENGQQLSTSTFTDGIVSFENLEGGNYELCFTVDTLSGFERCAGVALYEPQPLSVQSVVDPSGSEVALELTGGDTFEITVNGKTFVTSDSSISLPLDRIENTIEVRGAQDCQGVYTETIILSNEVFIYPNPVLNGKVSIYLGDASIESARAELYDFSGNKMYSKEQQATAGVIELNVNGLRPGIYMVQARTDNKLITHKLVIR